MITKTPCYLVFTEIPYEGIIEGTIKVFLSKNSAEKYLQELQEEYNGDYYNQMNEYLISN